MKNQFRATLAILEDLFKIDEWQDFLEGMKTESSKALASQNGQDEVTKFKKLFESLSFKQKTIQLPRQSVNITISQRSQIIHKGTDAFLLIHGYDSSKPTGSCEGGDIMWLHIVHNKQQKISFYRLNFMQNKNGNQESWDITQTQLHAMTGSHLKKISKPGTATSIIKDILQNITTKIGGDDYTRLSTYIGSYGLFTNDNMITLPARDVKQIKTHKTIKLAAIEQYYRQFYAYPQHCSPFYNLHFRLYPSFYKNIVDISSYKNVVRGYLRPYYKQGLRFLTFAENIHQLVENYLEFSFGELFYCQWDNGKPTVLTDNLGGSNMIIVETTISEE